MNKLTHRDDMCLARHSSKQQLVSVPATKRSQTHTGQFQEGTMCNAVGGAGGGVGAGRMQGLRMPQSQRHGELSPP